MERKKLTPQASDDPRHRGRTPRPFQVPKRPQAIVSEEEKAAILEQAKTAIIEGQLGLRQIAEQHRISHRTLQYWLAELGEEYETLRRAWIDTLLADAGEELEQIGGLDKVSALPVKLDRDQLNFEQLRLARAREIWKRATWYAERRDSARYGPKQEVTRNDKLVVIVDRSGGQAAPVTTPSIDSTVTGTGTVQESETVDPL